MKLFIRTMMMVAISFGVFASASANEAITNSKPHKLIADVTDSLLGKLKSGLDPQKDEKAFYDAVIADLEPFVAFDFIAKGVMGNHAAAATDAQRTAFSEKFKKGLLSAYGKGIANIAQLSLKVLPPEGDIAGQRKVAVVQEVRSSNDVTYVSYSMAQNGSGDWKLINVVFNGVNLGKTFRGQFAQSAQKYQGDIDKVIESWDQDVKKVSGK